VPPGATCLDVGANIGAHALVMARAAGPAGRVIAFEPHPELCERLRENVALNAGCRVEVVAAAVAGSDGEAELHAYDPGAYHRGGSSLLPGDARGREGGGATLRVPTLCGATIEQRFALARCDVVKIDVEGYDGVVLESLAALVERTRPVLVFEHRAATWARTGRSLADTLGRLGALGYALFVVQDGATRPLAGPPPASCELLALPLPATVVFAGGGAAPGAAGRLDAAPAAGRRAREG
jgi:FkbM family methyltransferase